MSVEYDIRRIVGMFVGSDRVQEWLDFPHPDLGGQTPQALMLEGNGQIVLDMLKNAIAGGMS